MDDMNTSDKDSEEKQTIETAPGPEIRGEHSKKISCLAIASLILSISLLLMIISLHRIVTNPAFLSVSYQTKEVYLILHKFCDFSPLIPFALGIAALVRIRFSRKELRGRKLAIIGIVIAALSVPTYWVCIFCCWAFSRGF